MTAADTETPPGLPQKVDPETLVLRGKPRPVARFRKGVVIGGVAALSAGIVSLTWLALEPVTFRKVADQASGRPYEQAAPDALAGAPRDYRDVPRLGPPLPGDLGRPILEQQRESLAAEAQPPATSSAPDARSLRLQERAAAEQAARSSSLTFPLADGNARPKTGSAPPAADPVPAAVPLPPSVTSKPQLGDWGRADVNPHELAASVSHWQISAGAVIPASLITGLNSDLPGMVVASVTENVRDSLTGRMVLIPQGARLIGRYDSGINYGQKRAFLIFERIVFPDGSSLRLDAMPASDTSGYAGLADRVDGHSWQSIRGVLLSSLLGVGSQLSFGSEGGLAGALRESVQRSGSQAGEQLVSKGLSVQPTVKVRPGWPVRVLVSEDLILPPWKG